MINIKDKKMCSGCYACVSSCPRNCINMISDEEGFWYPKVDIEKCINCGKCEKSCPIINKIHPYDNQPTSALAAMNTNDEIRLESSSGGMFTLLAEIILNRNGVVFGATFSDDYKYICHTAVNNVEELEKLRGSKYVQSRIGDSYKQAKNLLENGRAVLFTGTPCQISGLYSYLGKSYDNLYTQDFICHGVPSPMVWKKYVEEREESAGAKTRQVYFRHKKYGWKKYAMMFKFSNDNIYVKDLYKDSFLKVFLTNSCLRPSCHACSFKTIKHQADITLADFWGVLNVFPEMDDDKGTSLVLIHSNKGKKLFEEIKNNIKYKNVDVSLVSQYNPAIVNSSSVGVNRDVFLKSLNDYSIDQLAKIYFKPTLKESIFYVLRKIKIFYFIKNVLKRHHIHS